MSVGTGKALFFLALSVVAAVLVVAVYQVPQPWRGILVGWGLFLATAGAFTLRLLRHLCEYKQIQLTAKPQPRPAPVRRATRSSSERARRAEALKVVLSDSTGSGRHTIR